MIVEELVGLLGLKIDEAQWEKGERAVEGMKKGLEHLSESKFGERIKQGIEIFAGYEAVKHVKEFVEQTVEAAVSAKHLGERIGQSAEDVQELGYAADVTGSSSEELTVGMQHLARGMQELRTKGTGPAADALRGLKIPLNDAEIKHGKLDQVIEIVANRFAGMPDGVQKTAAAIDLFGRSGATLIPLLNKGASGIKELRAEAERLGVVIDEAGIKRAEEFEITQKKLHATLVGLRNQAVEALLPALQNMADGLLEWVQANRELIKQKIEELIPIIVAGVKLLGQVLGFVVNVLGWFSRHTNVAKIALIALVAIFQPWLLAALAVYAVLQRFPDLWEELSREASDTVNWIKDEFKALGDYLSDLWKRIKAEAHELWEDVKGIPIIGHAIKGVQAIGGAIFSAPKPGGVLDFFNKPGHGESDKANPLLPGLANPYNRDEAKSVPATQSTAVHVEGGPVSIHIDGATGDHKELAAEVAKQVKEAQGDMLRQAHDAVKGGRR